MSWTRGPRRAFALGVTLDPCEEGLCVVTIDQNGALGRTGRVVLSLSLPPSLSLSLSLSLTPLPLSLSL